MNQQAAAIPAQHDLTLCQFQIGSRSFGIDTRQIREVLGVTPVQVVPLTARFIAGMVAYRGEVLTAVSLRALLDLEPLQAPSCLLVLDGDPCWDGRAEQFGLMVDLVGGVVSAGCDLVASNPPPLEGGLRRLFQGVFRVRSGLIVQLDPTQMMPGRLCALEATKVKTR